MFPPPRPRPLTLNSRQTSPQSPVDSPLPHSHSPPQSRQSKSHHTPPHIATPPPRSMIPPKAPSVPAARPSNPATLHFQSDRCWQAPASKDKALLLDHPRPTDRASVS